MALIAALPLAISYFENLPGLSLQPAPSAEFGSVDIAELAYTLPSGLLIKLRDLHVDLGVLPALAFGINIEEIRASRLLIDARNVKGGDTETTEQVTAEKGDSNLAVPALPRLPLLVRLASLKLGRIDLITNDLEVRGLTVDGRLSAYWDQLNLHAAIGSGAESLQIISGSHQVSTNLKVVISLLANRGLDTSITLDTAEYRSGTAQITLPPFVLRSFSALQFTGETEIPTTIALTLPQHQSYCRLEPRLITAPLQLLVNSEKTSDCEFDLGRLTQEIAVLPIHDLKGQLVASLHRLDLPLQPFDLGQVTTSATLQAEQLAASAANLEILGGFLGLTAQLESGRLTSSLQVQIANLNSTTDGDSLFATDSSLDATVAGRLEDESLEHLKVKLLAREVTINTRKTALDLMVEADQKDDDYHLNAKLDLPSLLQMSASAEVDSGLQQVAGRLNFENKNLSATWSLIKPLVIDEIPIAYIPQQLSGRLRGEIELPPTALASLTDPSQLSSAADLKAKLSVTKLNYRSARDKILISDLSLDLTPRLAKSSLTGSIALSTKTVNFKIDEKNTFALESAMLNSRFASRLNPAAIVKSFANITAQLQLRGASYTDLPKIKQLDIAVKAAKTAKSVKLDHLQVAIPDLGLAFDTIAQLDLDQNARPNLLSGRSKLVIAEADLSTPSISIVSTGEISNTSEFVTDFKNYLTVEGRQNFGDYSTKVTDGDSTLLEVDRMRGSIAYDRTVDLSGAAPAAARPREVFRQLLYPSLAASFPGESLLTIDRVVAGDIEVENISGNISITNQNVYLSNFSMNSLSGTAEINLGLEFGNRLGDIEVAVGFTGLDSTRLLDRIPSAKGRLSSWTLGASPPLSGSIRLLANLREQKWNGQIKVTEIGKQQMMALLYYIDPGEQDRSLAPIRTALKAGDISYVYVPISEGYMALEVGVTIGQIPIPLPKISGLPLADILANVMGAEEIATEDSYEAI